ncbi:hypothetical protein UFOVP87_46 [uncultured Caudovirales phage]|uniref:Uncharacterized protein n=1 Tax=uncultured Caudovirales phage TaxID=2100421 RepID=A0A6J5KXA6_9CAUD|nr:hypothetical protein UFOVP87_46 [uncultured Caudovirales phage]
MTTEIPYSQLSKWDKFAEYKQICFCKSERHHAAVYLKALWLNDTETLNEFERFGTYLYEIMLNKRTYDQMCTLGYTTIEFDKNNWLIEPKLIPMETITFNVKGKYFRNYIEVCQVANKKWVIGINFNSANCGHGSGLSIWGDFFETKNEAFISGLQDMIKFHTGIKENTSVTILKLATEKLNELSELGQLTLF